MRERRDGSRGAEAAVREVAGRHWPGHTEARIVHAACTVTPIADAEAVIQVEKWITKENARVKEMLESATRKLRAAGLSVSSIVKEEDPKHLLCREAENWEADCIFVGSKGAGDVKRLVIGSVVDFQDPGFPTEMC